jgi:hypothetical protein
MAEENRTFGWLKDPYNPIAKIHTPTKVEYPSYFSLESYCPSVRLQIGSSCVGHGVGGTLGTVSKQLGAFIEWDSPNWIYNGARYLEGWLNRDCGCYPEDALKWTRDMGRLLERYWPHSGFTPATPTSEGRGDKAFKSVDFDYVRVADGIDGLISALAEGHPVNLGTPWPNSWGGYVEGILPTINKDSDLAGGHDTFLYGYDKTANVFFGQNSWGLSWGNKGRYKMPMGCFTVFKQMGGYDAHYVTFKADPYVPPTPPTPVDPHQSCVCKTVRATRVAMRAGRMYWKGINFKEE